MTKPETHMRVRLACKDGQIRYLAATGARLDGDDIVVERNDRTTILVPVAEVESWATSREAAGGWAELSA